MHDCVDDSSNYVHMYGFLFYFAHEQKLPDFEITLDAGRTERFCEHLTFFNNSDPNKFTSRPRVLLEVFYTGVYGGINKDMIKRVVQEAVDPNGCCL